MGQMQRGSAIARLAGMNTKKHPDVFDDSRVAVWVYEEEVRFLIRLGNLS